MNSSFTKRTSSLKQSSFVRQRTTKLVDDYNIVRQLGSGGFGQVFLLEDKETGWQRCGKLIRRDSLSAFDNENIMSEIMTLTSTDHPNIVRIICYYLTEEHIFIVSEFLTGGELFERVVKRKHFSEVDAAPLMAQLLSALAYLHKQNIVHRDIKPENLVFESPEDDAVLKIIDFGNSRKLTPNEKLKSKLGTLYYLAPEILDECYDTKCDIWSAGVVLFVLLYGVPPFIGQNDHEVLLKIKKGIIKPPERNYAISNEARALLSLMLNRDPKQRPPAEELLKHVWFARVRERKVPDQTEGMAIIHLQKFVTQNEFQKSILLYFVTQFDIKKQKRQLLEVFKSLDEDMDGQIERHELLQAYRKFTDDPRVDSVIQHIMDQLDLNESQSIDFTEFLLATTNYRAQLTEKNLEKIFDTIDVDKSKFITVREMGMFLNLVEPEQSGELQRIFGEADANGDGLITFDEFVQSMNQFLELSK